jgi:hypothetical protein
MLGVVVDLDKDRCGMAGDILVATVKTVRMIHTEPVLVRSLGETLETDLDRTDIRFETLRVAVHSRWGRDVEPTPEAISEGSESRRVYECVPGILVTMVSPDRKKKFRTRVSMLIEPTDPWLTPRVQPPFGPNDFATRDIHYRTEKATLRMEILWMIPIWIQTRSATSNREWVSAFSGPYSPAVAVSR